MFQSRLAVNTQEPLYEAVGICSRHRGTDVRAISGRCRSEDPYFKLVVVPIMLVFMLITSHYITLENYL